MTREGTLATFKSQKLYKPSEGGQLLAPTDAFSVQAKGNDLFLGKSSLLLLLVTRSLPRDGGMAEDNGAPEAGQLPRVWTRGRRETESRQRVSGTKQSLAGQCRMR